MQTFKLEAVFIDRDGTIGGTDEVVLPGDFKLFPKTKDSIEKLKKLGIKLFGFTNQPGISRGEVTKDAFESEMKEFGFDDVYICPHQHTEGCECRKPNPGMLHQAATENELNLSNCIVIGDRWSDILAANRAGCKKILVLTGAGNDALHKYKHMWSNIEADFIANDFEDAVRYIINLVGNLGNS
ncbi:D,D-heptose 1,7-bisphosphate phosphatase [Paenibacillus sp. J23TS9]|uniref:HAD-IIIA family hydrolase n=1 Tax=Paenibacillus sp. J23TS9 TaxID=2807193 RepID=UPI001B2D8F20|nr:HAD-IIIA family hydrolase [Paenibacillus sp. J23TS9]GIP27226.1 D,D-heptose 1,7-bisphosphate phosphatase [Paenibacillus sp. J23TS9]